MKYKTFIRKVENFVCKNCGRLIIGNGYTNHCPHCLYSLHVDINPGDRDNSCYGLMKPINVFSKGKTQYVVHKCLKCGQIKHNRLQKDDNFDIILDISTNPITNR